jgi:hypothetical protein
MHRDAGGTPRRKQSTAARSKRVHAVFFFDTFTVGEAPTVSFYIYMKNMYKDTETESKVQGGKKLQKKMKITRPER